MALLEGVLRLAAVNGSFGHGEALRAALGISEQTTAAWAREQWGREVDERVLVTALVLGSLRRQFGEERETWGLVAEKAMAWLRGREPEWVSATIPDVEALITAAAAPLPSESVSL